MLKKLYRPGLSASDLPVLSTDRLRLAVVVCLSCFKGSAASGLNLAFAATCLVRQADQTRRAVQQPHLELQVWWMQETCASPGALEGLRANHGTLRHRCKRAYDKRLLPYRTLK